MQTTHLPQRQCQLQHIFDSLDPSVPGFTINNKGHEIGGLYHIGSVRRENSTFKLADPTGRVEVSDSFACGASSQTLGFFPLHSLL